jgi:hypothetical protein
MLVKEWPTDPLVLALSTLLLALVASAASLLPAQACRTHQPARRHPAPSSGESVAKSPRSRMT